VLASNRDAGTGLDECPRCGGAWLDVEAFAALAADENRRDALLATLRSHAAADTPVSAPTKVCPRCGGALVRFDYAGASGIQLDACRTHGVWFDRDELRRVLEFIRSGSLHHRRDRHGDHGPPPSPSPEDDPRHYVSKIIDFILSSL